MRVILASSSTRRRDWISNQHWMNGHQIEFRSMDIDESRYSIEGDVPATVRNIANAKASHAGRSLGVKRGIGLRWFRIHWLRPSLEGCIGKTA